MILFLICVTTAVALITLLAPHKKSLAWIVGIGSTFTALIAGYISIPVLFSQPQLHSNTWYIDPFAALVLLLIGFVQWTAYWASIPYFKHEIEEGIIAFKQARMYYSLVQLFVVAMMITVLSNNIGLMWVALEATTLTTTLLVGLYAKKESLEAAWKYIILCSVGITLGLLGVFLVYYAAITGGVSGDLDGITWTTLHGAAKGFSPEIMKLAFIFIFLGFGTKIGLVPMHTWLPDAHSKAPSPLSAMLSGLLLNVALLAVLRYKSLVDIALGDGGWSNNLFIIFGAISFIVPAFFIVIQKNYKRMLAYSSIEHMGFMTFAIGLGPIGVVAAIIHMVGHALTKSMLFFGAGNILTLWKSTKFNDVVDVVRSAPYTGIMFLIGIFAILALPPSPLFISEYIVVGSAIGTHPYIIVAMLLAGVVIFAGMINRVITMLFQKKSETADVIVLHKEKWNVAHSAMLLHLVVLLVFGVSILSSGAFDVLGRIASYLF